MVPTGSEHAGIVKLLNHLLAVGVRDRAVVSVQDPVRLDDHSEPSPTSLCSSLGTTFTAPAIPAPKMSFCSSKWPTPLGGTTAR
jgi:hypothetical protein